MFGISIKAWLPDPGAARRIIEEGKREAALECAQAHLDLTTQRIRNGTRPDGGAHRAEAESTRRRKGRSQPLTDTGLLGRASAWRIVIEGPVVRVLPPEARERAVRYLERMDYPIFAHPDPELERKIRTIWERKVAEIEARMKSVMRRIG